LTVQRAIRTATSKCHVPIEADPNSLSTWDKPSASISGPIDEKTPVTGKRIEPRLTRGHVANKVLPVNPWVGLSPSRGPGMMGLSVAGLFGVLVGYEALWELLGRAVIRYQSYAAVKSSGPFGTVSTSCLLRYGRLLKSSSSHCYLLGQLETNLAATVFFPHRVVSSLSSLVIPCGASLETLFFWLFLRPSLRTPT